MIQPVQSGAALIEAPALWWLGQAAMWADLVLCTRKHSDRMDPGAPLELSAMSTRAKLVLPKSLAARFKVFERGERWTVPAEE